MIAAVLSVAAGGFAQTSVGFGLGLVSVSFLTTAIGQGPAVRAVLALSLIANVTIAIVERSGLTWRPALGLFVPSAITQLALFSVIRNAEPAPLTIAPGVVVIAAAALLALGGHMRFLDGRGGFAIAGATSAAMNLVAGLGGPAAVLYAANEGWSPHQWRPTVNAYFALNNLLSLVLLGRLPPGTVSLYVAALVGSVAGSFTAQRLPSSAIRNAALLLSALGGILAIRAGLDT